jgi:hypothetical protein
MAGRAESRLSSSSTLSRHRFVDEDWESDKDDIPQWPPSLLLPQAVHRSHRVAAAPETSSFNMWRRTGSIVRLTTAAALQRREAEMWKRRTSNVVLPHIVIGSLSAREADDRCQQTQHFTGCSLFRVGYTSPTKH